jgi:hypothetical protein
MHEGACTPLDKHTAVETMKTLIITNGLPQTDMALFGIKCPYCGKSDRIHKLEPPDELPQRIITEVARSYGALWHQLNPDGSPLGVCKFCLHPSALDLKAGQATVLIDD